MLVTQDPFRTFGPAYEIENSAGDADEVTLTLKVMWKLSDRSRRNTP
jgi:hypothetical protein